LGASGRDAAGPGFTLVSFARNLADIIQNTEQSGKIPPAFKPVPDRAKGYRFNPLRGKPS
jgi:hypothetical protein